MKVIKVIHGSRKTGRTSGTVEEDEKPGGGKKGKKPGRKSEKSGKEKGGETPKVALQLLKQLDAGEKRGGYSSRGMDDEEEEEEEEEGTTGECNLVAEKAFAWHAMRNILSAGQCNYFLILFPHAAYLMV